MKRQNRNNTQASNKSSFEMQKLSLEFQEIAFLYFATRKLFEKRITSRNIPMTTCTYSESTDQQHLCIKFLGDKKGPTIGFYLEV